MSDIQSIAVLTGGGDCPGLNAVLRAVTKTAISHGMKVWGIKNGFGGLIQNHFMELTDAHVSGILPRGGTILGTTNRDNPFHYAYIDETGVMQYKDMSGQAMNNLQELGVQALVVIGGDGSLRIAEEFSRLNLPVVAVPKTIDNDIPGTERTFGFDTAVGIAAEALDRLHTTAESHHRVMILEVMGRYAGWIALHAGMAGGADIILLPEIPYDIKSVLDKIDQRQQSDKKFSIVVVAEGAVPLGGSYSVSLIVEGSEEKIRLGGAGEKLARDIEKLSGVETRCTVLGHLQRGGTPSSYDRVLATRYGVVAVENVLAKNFGCMVALQQNRIVTLPLISVAGKAHNVGLDDELLLNGREIGICFGD